MRSWGPWAALIALSALLTLPAALGPMRLNESFWIDWVWLDQFAEQLRQGILYPRWLPLSHGGLGSPVFYYYPPLAFYLGSIFSLAGLTTYASLIAAFFAAYALSGVAMYAWLRNAAPRPLLGAMAYVVAPYHAFNFYSRGAIAETLATALLPFVMIGIRRLARGERGGYALAAVSYGLLIATHLPLALLASLFLFAPYALLWIVRSDWQRLVPMTAALATGMALASAYLLPALLLEPYRDAAKLWHDPSLQPANWTVWNPSFWVDHSYHGVLLIAAAISLPLLVFAVWQRSGWAMWGLACTLVAVGAAPLIWHAPLLRSVQFPFRLLPIAEFAAAAAFAFVSIRPIWLTLIAVPSMFLTSQIVQSASAAQAVTFAEMQAAYPDVPENLPPGPRPYSWPSRWAIALAGEHRQPVVVNGTTVDTVFYFPAWQVRCGGQRTYAFPEPEARLLSYKGQSCNRWLGLTLPERVGRAISLLGLLGLLGFWAFRSLGRRP